MCYNKKNEQKDFCAEWHGQFYCANTCGHTNCTELQNGQFAALKEREYHWKFLMVLSNFKPKNYHFGHFHF